MGTSSIKPFQYTFSEDDIQNILECFGNILRQRKFLTMGDYGEQFEQFFAQYQGCKHAVAVSSGTAAIEIILKTLNVAGKKVIVPTNTFGATIIPVLRAGAIPVFADCTDDMTLSPLSVAQKMTPDVKAVITVHIGGLISPHTYHIQALCEQHGIPLIEDAAHAVGASLDGKRAGSFGIAAAFSFFSTKLLTTGEGGMIITNNEALTTKARLFRNHAKQQTNRMIDRGYNWRLLEISALMGIRQLQHLDEYITKRNVIATIYDEVLRDIEGIQIVRPPSNAIHNRYKYIIILVQHSPILVQTALKKQYDIPLGGYVYEEPCHQQPAFIEFDGSDCKTAEKLCPSHICLPIYQEMTENEGYYVAEKLCSVLRTL